MKNRLKGNRRQETRRVIHVHLDLAHARKARITTQLQLANPISLQSNQFPANKENVPKPDCYRRLVAVLKETQNSRQQQLPATQRSERQKEVPSITTAFATISACARPQTIMQPPMPKHTPAYGSSTARSKVPHYYVAKGGHLLLRTGFFSKHQFNDRPELSCVKNTALAELQLTKDPGCTRDHDADKITYKYSRTFAS